jgi:murein L,D-transpeptidase YcbB/YkuD
LDSIYKEQRDRQITGIVLNFIKNLQEGSIIYDFDAIRTPRDSVYIKQLLSSKPQESVTEMVERLDCKDQEYLVLKNYLQDSKALIDSLKNKKIALAMNYARYFSVYHLPERIVVNIPETEVRYYQNDFLKLKMRAVVGRKTNPTPTIASYVTDIVTFPRWNVPHSIAVTEILPKVQAKENYLEQNNYEVVNSKGHVIDESILKWKSYDEKNFPYFFRQGTGNRNAMGVIKFDLANPFSIFLHATSWQGAFAKDYRFLSHGCIRLEKPFVLADRLLNGEIDIKKLKGGKKNTETKTIRLLQKVPVFIIYNPVIVLGKKVTFLPDTYGLIN